MLTIAEVQKLAFDLPEKDRALLAESLLHSLSAPLQDEDEGIAVALARDADLETGATEGITLEQLDERIQRRRDGCG